MFRDLKSDNAEVRSDMRTEMATTGECCTRSAEPPS